MSETPHGSHDPAGKTDYRHTYRLIAVLVLALGGAVGARKLLVPATYGQFGAYRGAAAEEARHRPVRHVGSARCADCHADKHKLKMKDAHTRVQCEVCHGAGGEHTAWHEPRKSMTKEQRGKAPKEAQLRVRKEDEWCMVCHGRMDSRPGSFPQVARAEHFKLVGAANDKVTCRACHVVHEPLRLDLDVRQAVAHPMLQRCKDCHTGKLRLASSFEGNKGKSPHRSIFECASCHKAQAATRGEPHQKLPCSTCHPFFKDSEISGRMVRSAGPGFCLLCHEAGPHRDDKSRPTIEWPSHREEVGDKPEDAKKVCADCHRETFHGPAKPAPMSAASDDKPAKGEPAKKEEGE